MTDRPKNVSDDASDYAVALLHAHPEPLAILAEGLKLRAANAAFCELVSLDLREAQGRNLRELGLAFSDGAAVEDALNRVLVTGVAMDDRRVKVDFPGRGARTLSITARRIELDSINYGGILVSLLRRTRWQPGQKGYEHNLALLRSISASTWDVILTLTEDGLVERASSTTASMFGYSPSEAVGMDLGSLISRTGGGTRVSRIKDALKAGASAGGTSSPGEFFGLRKDGTRIPVEVSISEIDEDQRFTCMIRNVSERRRLEQEILDISAEEQRRIGLELHDDTLQAFTGMQLVAEELMDLLASDSHEMELARMLAENNAAASRRARLLARGLIPTRIPSGGLIAALDTLASDISELHAVTVSVEHDDSLIEFPDDDTETHIFRIVQEAASNAARHSGSDRIRISLACEEQRLVVRIGDRGSGFDEDRLGEQRGLGLRIMAYRADLIGAELSIENWRGGGTVVVLSVPHYQWNMETPDAVVMPRPNQRSCQEINGGHEPLDATGERG